MPRFYCPVSLYLNQVIDLPPSVVRHIQVLRLQPGHTITLFHAGFTDSFTNSGEFLARIDRIGRNDVQVSVIEHHSIEREALRKIHLALAIPANERMDWLVEKATELGVTSVQPLITQRSIVKLDANRSEKKIAHWQSIAISACEQSGRNQVPLIHPLLSFADWLKLHHNATLCLLSLSSESIPFSIFLNEVSKLPLILLSGPEGGFTQDEESAAVNSGFIKVSLGPRTLRADTAPLAALSALTLLA
jgi:16S rRNA (uracil1498-N3)-methyltransferase